MYSNTFYSHFRSPTFSEVYPDFETFKTEYNNLGLNYTMKEEYMKSLYVLLLGRYANSHTAHSSIDIFKIQLGSIIYEYGPSWEKRMELQKELRDMTTEEYREGSGAIYNHSFNPSTDPSTLSDQILPTIDDQNTTKYKKSKLEGLTIGYSSLVTDVTEMFITKFRRLFVKVLMTGNPLLYATYEDNMIQEDE